MASPTVDKPGGKPRRKRRWFQFGLATLLGLVTLVAIVLGLVVNPAEQQRRAVAVVHRLGGGVEYEDEEPHGGNVSLAPEWLRESLGKHYFRSVIRVSLSYTRLSDAGLAHLKGLTGLQGLSLDDTQVSDAGLVNLRGLTGLQELYLSGTRVTEAGLVYLKGLTGLHGLSLDGTAVSDARLAHLNGLTRLQWVSLNGTQVSDAGLAELRAGLPDCLIYGP
jgi:hypothetical protein